MEEASELLRKRMDGLTRPEPTIVIFNGQEYYITDTGEKGSRCRVAVQLSVQFREKQLGQLKGPILGVFVCIALHINERGLAWPSIKLIAVEMGQFKSNVYQLFPKSRVFKAKDRV